MRNMILPAAMLASLHLIIIYSLVLIAKEAWASVAKPGCQQKCGDIANIPYPFGIGQGCYLGPHFEITCDTSSNPPRVLLGGTQILHISEDYLRINVTAYRSCFNQHSGKTDISYVPYNNTNGFNYSHTLNNFVAIGCDVFAYILENRNTTYAAGCASLCPNYSIDARVSSPPCSGIGCCRTPLHTDVSSFDLRIRSINMLTPAWQDRPCSVAFIADKNFSIRKNFDISGRLDKDMYFVPAILDWSVGNLTCPDAMRTKDHACGQNADCINSNQGQGYKCRCSQGYQGNAYLPNGCQDINECHDPNKNDCDSIAVCTNIPGKFSCTCPTGYHGDGKKHGFGCKHDKRKQLLLLVFSLGMGITVITVIGTILVIVGLRLYRGLEEREKKKIRQKFFKKNGGLLLLQQISSSTETVEKTKIYSAEELEKATNGFNSSRIIGKGGLGTVYKGMLSDGSIVAIKKSNTLDNKQLEQFANEVFFLSQINHRHIVKLLGCCLETEGPLLVYEYVSYGTLFHHLHDEGLTTKISWRNRLRIASEIAGALAYLHSYASIPICHRDVKSSNILLDENLRAVVSDFGLSRSIPRDKTHLTALVQGTFGYLDPEYFHSGQFTDKSDVYAFGVVLAELLTGEQAISSGKFEEGLAIHFKAAMKENRLFEILDEEVVNEGQKEEIFAVAKLTKRCLKLNGKKRPTMKQAEIELQQLGGFQEHFSFQKTRTEEPPLEQQICQDYCSVSERSHSYTFGPATEEIAQDDESFLSQ